MDFEIPEMMTRVKYNTYDLSTVHINLSECIFINKSFTKSNVPYIYIPAHTTLCWETEHRPILDLL